MCIIHVYVVLIGKRHVHIRADLSRLNNTMDPWQKNVKSRIV